MLEFVAIDEHGVERDWVDPVISVESDDTHHLVDNGYGVHGIPKREGWTYVTRQKAGEQGEC